MIKLEFKTRGKIITRYEVFSTDITTTTTTTTSKGTLL